MCASEAVEPVISNLVSVLLKGCQDSSPETRLLCGECLGELGAVDPGRLDLSRSHTNGGRNTFVVRPVGEPTLVVNFRHQDKRIPIVHVRLMTFFFLEWG